MSKKFSRRAMLVGAGGATLALPYLASWRTDSGGGVLSSSRALATDAAPKRFALWMGWWGTMPEWWSPLNTNPDGTQFELNKIMEPLAPIKDKLTVISGVTPVSLFAQGGRGGSHNQGAVSVTTGGRLRQDGDPLYGGNPWSEDPHVVNLLARKMNPRTAFEAPLFGDGSDHDHGFWRDADGNPMWSIWTPASAFDTLFRDFVGDSDEIRRIRAGRLSVIDAVLPGYQHMRSRLSSSDKPVLDDHVQALADLERRTNSISVCTAPNKPPNVGGREVLYDDYYYDFAEILARAFACNLTHFLSFGLNGDRVRVRGFQSPNFDAINPANTSGGVHGYGHAGWNTPSDNQVWGEIQQFRMKVFSRFCQRLNEFQDVDGTSVLDNSCVLYTSEIATGLHDIFPLQEWGYGWTVEQNGQQPPPINPRGLPLLYAGGLGGKLKTGRHFEFDKAGADRFAEKLGKYSITEVYLTIARALGIGPEKLPRIGIADACSQVAEDLLV